MKLFLIDGHALIFKMYYAFLGRPMVNSKGVDTSILFGFTKYLLELIERERPSHLAVCFDPPGGTFRNEMYPAYKANRPPTPQLVIDALEPLQKIVGAMNIPVMMLRGFEADDVIGSASKRFAAQGAEVYMVTPDKDYGQLVAPGIWQYKPGKAGTDHELLGEKEICDKWGIDRTSQVIDILAICGDSADNVPGVQGVGPVGASKLLKQYGSVAGIYGHLEELSASMKAKFEAAEDHIGLSRELVTVKTDIPIDLSLDSMSLSLNMTADLAELFDLYEFNSLKRHFKICAEAPVLCPDVPVDDIPDSAVVFAEIDANSPLRLHIYSGGKLKDGAPEEFRTLLEDAAVTKIGADLKPLLNALGRLGIDVKGKLEDIELIHYLLNPERQHNLTALAMSYLGEELETEQEACTGSLFDDVPETPARDCARTIEAIRRIDSALRKELDASPQTRRLYDEVEEPLLKVLSGMECRGVKIDMSSLGEYTAKLRGSVLEQERLVREIAGEPSLNVSSPKQVGEVIFEKLRLDPGAKKPRSGNWPTDEQTLSELADRSPIIDAILEYRGLKKLLNTYIEPLPGYVSPIDGRVHTSFNQTLTATGRLSSSNPNLQNIPIRTEQGREIRKAFVPGISDAVIMSADYSQVELRLMAHFCSDEHLIQAFRSGEDVHKATASKIFNVPASEVTSEQRRVAKTANFGIMYGISAFGLSQRLKCSRSEASKIISDYFESFPSIRAWIDSTLASARENGYVETLFGRRRYVPEIVSPNANVRAVAERNAVNAPIQGTAADIIKLAMIRVDEAIRNAGLRSSMVLQIHDELVLEVPSCEIGDAEKILVDNMENVLALQVPLTVECNYGKTWLEAH